MKFDKLEKLLNEYHCLEDGIAVACGGTGGTKDVDAMSERLDELLAIPEVAERIQTEREEEQKEIEAACLAQDLIGACINLTVERVREAVSRGANVNAFMAVFMTGLDCKFIGCPPLFIVYDILNENKLTDGLYSSSKKNEYKADAVKKAKEIIKILLDAGADCTTEIKGKPIIEYYRSMPVIFSVFKEAYERDKKALETFSSAAVDRIGGESPVRLIVEDSYLLRSIGELTMRIPASFFPSVRTTHDSSSSKTTSASALHDDESSSKKTCVIS